MALEEHEEPKAQPGNANLSPKYSVGVENLTVSVSPGTLYALVTFGVRTESCQLFLPQKHQLFSPRIAFSRKSDGTGCGFFQWQLLSPEQSHCRELRSL